MPTFHYDSWRSALSHIEASLRQLLRRIGHHVGSEGMIEVQFRLEDRFEGRSATADHQLIAGLPGSQGGPMAWLAEQLRKAGSPFDGALILTLLDDTGRILERRALRLVIGDPRRRDDRGSLVALARGHRQLGLAGLRQSELAYAAMTDVLAAAAAPITAGAQLMAAAGGVSPVQASPQRPGLSPAVQAGAAFAGSMAGTLIHEHLGSNSGEEATPPPAEQEELPEAPSATEAPPEYLPALPSLEWSATEAWQCEVEAPGGPARITFVVAPEGPVVSLVTSDGRRCGLAIEASTGDPTEAVVLEAIAHAVDESGFLAPFDIWEREPASLPEGVLASIRDPGRWSRHVTWMARSKVLAVEVMVAVTWTPGRWGLWARAETGQEGWRNQQGPIDAPSEPPRTINIVAARLAEEVVVNVEGVFGAARIE